MTSDSGGSRQHQRVPGCIPGGIDAPLELEPTTGEGPPRGDPVHHAGTGHPAPFSRPTAARAYATAMVDETVRGTRPHPHRLSRPLPCAVRTCRSRGVPSLGREHLEPVSPDRRRDEGAGQQVDRPSRERHEGVAHDRAHQPCEDADPEPTSGTRIRCRSARNCSAPSTKPKSAPWTRLSRSPAVTPPPDPPPPARFTAQNVHHPIAVTMTQHRAVPYCRRRTRC